MPDERITSEPPSAPPSQPRSSPTPGTAPGFSVEYRTAFRWAVVVIVALMGLCIWLSIRDQSGGGSQRNAGELPKPANLREKVELAPFDQPAGRPAERPDAQPRKNGVVADPPNPGRFVPDPPKGKAPAAAKTVYITKTGKKYHAAGCSYLRQSQIAISLDDAIKQGYTACSRCGP
jgi:hypothetical protein